MKDGAVRSLRRLRQKGGPLRRVRKGGRTGRGGRCGVRGGGGVERLHSFVVTEPRVHFPACVCVSGANPSRLSESPIQAHLPACLCVSGACETL